MKKNDISGYILYGAAPVMAALFLFGYVRRWKDADKSALEDFVNQGDFVGIRVNPADLKDSTKELLGLNERSPKDTIVLLPRKVLEGPAPANNYDIIVGTQIVTLKTVDPEVVRELVDKRALTPGTDAKVGDVKPAKAPEIRPIGPISAW